MKFIRVTKDNHNHDRGIIAIDAICSVFENKDSHNVTIMTMDGFWYDVKDDYEKIDDLIMSTDSGESRLRRDFYRSRKMLPPKTAEEKTPCNHNAISIYDKPSSDLPNEDIDVFKKPKVLTYSSRPRPRFLKRHKNLSSKNMSSGEDKGHYDSSLASPIEKAESLEGL